MDQSTASTIGRARPSSRARARRASSQRPAPSVRYALVAVAAFSLLVGSAVAVDAISSAGKVHPGVAVGGVQVGGKTPAEATRILQAALPAKAAVPVKVALGSHTWSVKADEVGASFDYTGLIDNAMLVGRSGGFAASARQRVNAWLHPVALPARATADPSKLDATVNRIASAVDVAPKDAALKVSASSVALKPSANGVAVQRQQLTDGVLNAFAADGSRTVPVRTVVTPPRIRDSAAADAQKVVARMVSRPVTVTYKDHSWTISPKELAEMIECRPEKSGDSASARWSLVPRVGVQQASRVVLPKVGAALGTPAKDAQFAATGGSVTIVPSKNGIGPDTAGFASDLTAVLTADDSTRTVELRAVVVPPRRSTDQARAMGIRGLISTFTTPYSTQVPSRVNNIHVLGAALNGQLVAPGDTFSLNGAVGQRTAEKGYQEANAIVKGKLVPQMGGGICQVATTLFNAVFMSGLPIVERTNHSFYIAHYPMGRDATVSWDGPDLRWKNTTGHWVLVSVACTSNTITVSLYGTRPGYQVSYTTVPFTNNVPFKTTRSNVPTLPAGTQQVLATGENGGRTVVKRTVRRGGSVVRTDTFTSDYTPVDAVIAVGTKAAAPKPTMSARKKP